VSGRVDAIVSVVVSQLLDGEPSWPEYRIEFRPTRTDTSDGDPILVPRYGNGHKRHAYTFRIRRRVRKISGEQVVPRPNHPFQAGELD